MRRKIKWFFTLIGIVLFCIAGSSFADDELGGRAMAVGLGIDINSSDEIIVFAQILTSAASSETAAGTRVVEAADKVLSSAISKVSETCGLTLTVSHCNVVLIGERLMKHEKFFNELMALFENTYVSDNAYIFGCEGSPGDIFKSKSGFGNNASQYIQKLVAMYGTYDNISRRMLRELVSDNYDFGATTYLPFIKKLPIAPIVPNSSQCESVGEDSDYVYTMTDVSIFRDNEFIGTYDENASRAINYIMNKVNKGGDEFETDKGVVGVYILQSQIKKEFDLDKKKVSGSLKIGVVVKDYFFKENVKNYDGSFTYTLSEEETKECAKVIQQRITDFYNDMKNKNADIFHFRQNFYSKYGNKAKNIKLSDIDFDLKVELTLEK